METTGYKTITDEMRNKAKSMRQNPDKICGAFAPTSGDGICRNWAGMRTDHPKEGACWLHDQEPVKQVDLIVTKTEYENDPDILELSGEIQMLREYIRLIDGYIGSGEVGTEVGEMVKLMEALRKLISTKHQIEVQRNFLIPVSVAVNLARRISDIVAKYLPLEQRVALQEEIREALRIELATGTNNNPTRIGR